MNDETYNDILMRLSGQGIYLAYINNDYYIMSNNSGYGNVYVMKDVTEYIVRKNIYKAAFLIFNTIYSCADMQDKPHLAEQVFYGGIVNNNTLKVIIFPSNSMLLYNTFKYSEKAVEFSSYMLEEILYE
jgi:uncharacterized membrane protein